jgi:hypothetical protein
MTYVYYNNNKKYKTKEGYKIPFDKISSPNEDTPAYEDLESGEKRWCEKGRIWHRLTGPAIIHSNGSEWFYLNDICYYENVKDWLEDHPNQENAFQVEMLLKYT